jgi:hypothetical protein
LFTQSHVTGWNGGGNYICGRLLEAAPPAAPEHGCARHTFSILDTSAFSVFNSAYMAINLETVTTDQLKRILELRQQIDALKGELRQIESGGTAAPATPATPVTRGRKKGKRHFSAEARQKMAEAQRRRWAAKRDGRPPAAEAKPAAKGKRIMTDAWRAKIAAAQKARWAAKKGASAPAKEAKPARKKKTMTPAALAALAKARAARWAKAWQPGHGPGSLNGRASR